MQAYFDMDVLENVKLADDIQIKYSYDNSCRLIKTSTPYGDTKFEYDLMDRITRVVDRDGVATLYEYDANGNRTAVKYANGITTTYVYNDVNQLICEQSVDKDNNVMVKYAYALGKSGERLKVTELDSTTEYGYDELYRLTAEKVTNGKDVTEIKYTYDKLGNRLTKTENGQVTKYSYNNLNQLVSETGIHTNSNAQGESWNKGWENYKKKYPNATSKEIIAQLQDMEKSYDIAKYRAIKNNRSVFYYEILFYVGKIFKSV